jgi:predicted dehydrogenase
MSIAQYRLGWRAAVRSLRCVAFLAVDLGLRDDRRINLDPGFGQRPLQQHFALDLVRWFLGDPVEVFCYTNRILMKDWPTDDTGVAIFKFKNNIIGKVFVSIGIKREYTMRTVICGTKGTIICDNTSPSIKMYKDKYLGTSGTGKFWDIPVNEASHNVAAELAEFVSFVRKNKQTPMDVYEGTRTVAFGEAALTSARTGKPVKLIKL